MCSICGGVSDEDLCESSGDAAGTAPQE
ncbi:hypothetical protein [Brevibacterium casei]